MTLFLAMIGFCALVLAGYVFLNTRGGGYWVDYLGNEFKPKPETVEYHRGSVALLAWKILWWSAAGLAGIWLLGWIITSVPFLREHL